MDWSDKAGEALQDEEAIERFTTTQKFEDCYLEWHRSKYPEEWEND